MKESAKTFFELLSKDEELRKKVCAMTELEDIIALAKEHGIELTEADFEAQDAELSEDELNAVVGGACTCTAGGTGTPIIDDGCIKAIDMGGYFCYCTYSGYGDGKLVY